MVSWLLVYRENPTSAGTGSSVVPIISEMLLTSNIAHILFQNFQYIFTDNLARDHFNTIEIYI